MPAAGVRSVDTVVVGGGIAGVSAAWALARRGYLLALVEREQILASHSTGRSAAQFLASYGGPANPILSAASRPFLEAGAAGLADAELLVPRDVLWVELAVPRRSIDSSPTCHERAVSESCAGSDWAITRGVGTIRLTLTFRRRFLGCSNRR